MMLSDKEMMQSYIENGLSKKQAKAMIGLLKSARNTVSNGSWVKRYFAAEMATTNLEHSTVLAIRESIAEQGMETTPKEMSDILEIWKIALQFAWQEKNEEENQL